MAYADIKMGYSCNNNCIHCVVASQRESKEGSYDRTTDEYKRELHNSRINGCNSVTFTGGEPTIRKDLIILLNYAKSLGFHINMQTNGRMFYYKKFTERFTPFNIWYTIALHSHNAKLHDNITRSERSFEQTVNGIKNLISSNQRVSGKLVISKKNYKDLPEIALFFIELGIKEMNFAFPHPQGNAWKYFDVIVPRYTEIESFVHKAISVVNKYNKEQNEKIQIKFEAIPFCFMKDYEKNVSELKFLENEYIELKQPESGIFDWNAVRKKIKSKFDKCEKCAYNNVCEGVWKEYVVKYDTSEFK